MSRNYARIQVRDELLRLDGVGDVTIFGQRDYSMRVWLDPEKLVRLRPDRRRRGRGAARAERAGRGRRDRPAAGAGRQRLPAHREHPGPLRAIREQFDDIIVKTGADGRLIRLSDVARVELGARDYVTNSLSRRQAGGGLAIFQLPGSNALAHRRRDHRQDGGAEEATSRPASTTSIVYDTTRSSASRSTRSTTRCSTRSPGRHRRARVPAELAHRPHSARRRAGVADRHVRRHGGARLLAQQPDAVRPGAGHRHRGRRRHRRRRERRAQHRRTA